MKFTCSRFLVLAGICVSVAFAAPSYQVEEKIVGPASEQGTIYTLSPTGMRVATVSAKGSRFVVTLDGVEGPAFDEIMKAAGEREVRFDFNGNPTVSTKWHGPVAFSPDGRRHAYVARLDKELRVMLDGKEIHRAAYSASFPAVSQLFFSPDSQRLFFYVRTTDTMNSHQLMIDGKVASPAFAGQPAPLFSSDGKRWVLLATKPAAPNELFLLVDGKEAGYVGLRPQFTPDGKRVVSVRVKEGEPAALLVDGKPLFTAQTIDGYVISASGDIAALATPSGGATKRLFLNGKEVAGVDHVAGVVFSPNGKRWAAWCAAHPSAWVVVDGKRQQNYTRVHGVAFSPDSSTVLYQAETGVKKFVVTNGQEDSGSMQILTPPTFSEQGATVAYAVGETQSMNSRRAVIDGVPQASGRMVQRLTLSQDGKRHAYYLAKDALVSSLIVDGQEIGAANAEGDQVMFSPDGRTIAALVRPPQSTQGRSLYVNGEFIFASELSVNLLLGFTADNQHLLTMANEQGEARSGNLQAYRLNGQLVAQFLPRAVSWANPVGQRLWEAQPDGSILLLGVEPGPNQTFGPMKRVRVVPSSSATITAWLTEVRADRDRAQAAAHAAIAEAQAAKAKKEADRLAALEDRRKAQAEASAARAQAKAEADALRAKAKADAAAAKAKR